MNFDKTDLNEPSAHSARWLMEVSTPDRRSKGNWHMGHSEHISKLENKHF